MIIHDFVTYNKNNVTYIDIFQHRIQPKHSGISVETFWKLHYYVWCPHLCDRSCHRSTRIRNATYYYLFMNEYIIIPTYIMYIVFVFQWTKFDHNHGHFNIYFWITFSLFLICYYWHLNKKLTTYFDFLLLIH